MEITLSLNDKNIYRENNPTPYVVPSIFRSKTVDPLGTTGFRIVIIGELPAHNIPILSFSQLFESSRFSCSFLPNMSSKFSCFLSLLKNFTNSDRTPPYLDTYFQLFPKLGKILKKNFSDKNGPFLEGNIGDRKYEYSYPPPLSD